MLIWILFLSQKRLLNTGEEDVKCGKEVGSESHVIRSSIKRVCTAVPRKARDLPLHGCDPGLIVTDIRPVCSQCNP